MITIVGQCPVKALNAELAIAFLHKAVMRFMTSPIHKWYQQLLMRFIANNAFLIPLKWVTAKVKLDKGLGFNPTSAIQAIASRFQPSHRTLNS